MIPAAEPTLPPGAAPAARTASGLATDTGLKNLHQLIQLRWIAVFGQIVTIEVVHYGFRIALPIGHIHADLFPDNVFFLDGRLSGLIDFYFAATDFLAYDIAICLNAWCFEPDLSFNVTKARSLLAAYTAARPLSAAERAALPVLCQGAALRFALTRLFDAKVACAEIPHSFNASAIGQLSVLPP